LEKRKLGTSELYVSELGLGCMSIGTDQAKGKAIIEAALEEGINYFDTADLYDQGVNERIVGSSLKSVREKVIIATKAGNRWNENGDGWHWDPSKKYIKEAVKSSLSRLGTDYIDLYQLHGGTIEDPIDETIEAFEELKDEGLIRYYGISSIRPNVIREYVQKSSIVSVMMQYSLLDRRPEETVFPLLTENNISVVTRGPLARGVLSEKMLEKAPGKGYLNYSYSEIKDLLQTIQQKLITRNRSMTELALGFNLSSNPVSSVIAGASSVDQVRENAQAVRASKLTEEEQKVLQTLTNKNRYEDHR
jgi:aryl-alcohol dehydrogenase-like predicted oxidoreductase